MNMATFRKRGNSFELRAFAGYDEKGKQIIKFKTWKIPEGMTEKKAQKEAEKQAILFEEMLNNGLIADEKSMKFTAYAEKWFADYAATQLRPRTIDGYRRLMDRVYPAIGHLYIDKIRPAHLVKFYRELSETSKSTAYTCTIDLKAILKAAGMTQAAFSEKNGIALGAVKKAATGGNISLQNAEQISKALGKPVKEVFAAAGDEKLSASTVGKYHRVLSTMFETAVKWGMIVSNPCERVDPPKAKKPKKEEAQYLTAEQAITMLELLEHEPEQYQNAVTLLLFTGMRRGELLGLEWSDYDREHGLLSINKTVQYLPDRGVYEDDTKNSTSCRVIKLSHTAEAALQAQFKWQTAQRLKVGSLWEGTNKIFSTATGGQIHPDTLTGWFRSFIDRSGLPPIHLHSLRHTNATLQIANGSAVTTVAGYLGHANANTTTKVYAHAIQAAQAAAAERIEDVLNPGKVQKIRRA